MTRLAASHLTCLRGARLVFEDLGFDLAGGDALLLTGPNGSGKSSLMRVLAGLLEPFDGSVDLDGTAAYIGHHDPVKPTLTVQESLDFWASLYGAAASDVDTALEELALTDLAPIQGRLLSSGQRRRLTLARLLVQGAEIWLMDEPTVGLDTAAVKRVEALVAAHRANGGIVVLSTHIEFALPGAQTLDLGDFAPGRALDHAGGIV